MSTRLLSLYPPAWRERYGDEFAELLAARPPSLRDQLDIVRGAVDARIHPQVVPPPLPRTVAGRDGLLAISAVTAGLMFSAWSAVIVLFSPRWGEMGSVDNTILGLSYAAGMLGAMLGIAVLLGTALRHVRDMGAIGLIGAAIGALGFLAFTSESGAIGISLLFAGTIVMSVGIGRAFGRLVSTVMVGATSFVALAMFGFIGGDGQELLWLWMLVVYGPSWILLGANLRKGVRVSWTPTPAVPPSA
jgi:hypothetical protein